jgi:type IV pilus assembly protein PilA
VNDPNAPPPYPQPPYLQVPQLQQGGGYPQPPQKPKSGAAPWVIGCAVAAGAGLLIVGMLAVLAISGVRTYIAAAKKIEATATLGQIALDAQSSFDRVPVGALPATPSEEKHALCPSASRSVPATIASVRGKKYMSAPSDWAVDSAADAGFACLRFEMSAPQYYMYSYSSTPPGTAVGNGFEAIAEGDLDGNGVTSTFSLTGKIGAGEVIVIAPTIAETNPKE